MPPGGPSSGESAATAESDAEKPVIVAVFLPDGSAMAAGQVYLTGFERAASLVVNHWTGGVKVSEVDLTAKAAGEKEPAIEPARDAEVER